MTFYKIIIFRFFDAKKISIFLWQSIFSDLCLYVKVIGHRICISMGLFLLSLDGGNGIFLFKVLSVSRFFQTFIQERSSCNVESYRGCFSRDH